MFRTSMLVPTRERPHMLENFIQSVLLNTKFIENINIYFICDDDDTLTQEHVEIIKKRTPQVEIHLLCRPRSEMLNEDYYNFAARQADGDLLWILADDLIIVQPNWDEHVDRVAQSAFNAWPDRVVCFSLRDNTPPPSHKIPKFPCFPMLTPQAMKSLGGWILHPKVPTWGADYVTYCIFEPIGRLIQLHDTNYLNHVSWHNKQVAVDHINERIGQIFNKLKMISHHNTDRIIAEECPAIRGHIKDYIKSLAEQVPGQDA